jgi:hypothetical protein
MTTDYSYDDHATPRPPQGRHSLEWGLAALFIGSVVSLMFPMILLVIGLGGALAMNWRQWDPDNLRLADNVAHIVVYLLLGLAAVGALCGIYGLVRALGGRQPLGACLGGLAMSLIAVALMVVLSVIVTAVSREFYKELPSRSRPAAVDSSPDVRLTFTFPPAPRRTHDPRYRSQGGGHRVPHSGAAEVHQIGYGAWNWP